MPVNPQAVGTTSAPLERSWTSKDCLLYAVGVGAGQDPDDELQFTTENSHDVQQQVLPTMPVVLGGIDGSLFAKIGTFDMTKMLHGAQEVVLHGPLPVEGTVATVGKIEGIWDKTKSAVAVMSAEARDAKTGEPRFTLRTTLVLRGEGGFGGERGPSFDSAPPPDRAPDHEVSYTVRPEQALIYRLSGDRNPLHADPWFAKQGGLDRPILHGLCTYGFTGRALLSQLCGGDPGRMKRMAARFSAPVLPGDTLTIKIWRTGPGQAVFTTSRTGGQVVLDGGQCEFVE